MLPLSSFNRVLGPTESPAVAMQSSPIKVFSFSEAHRTRHNEKKSDEEEKEVDEEEAISEGKKRESTSILGPRESPAAAKKTSPFKVVSFSELEHRTRHQEKVAMEEVEEQRKKVMQSGFLN